MRHQVVTWSHMDLLDVASSGVADSSRALSSLALDDSDAVQSVVYPEIRLLGRLITKGDALADDEPTAGGTCVQGNPIIAEDAPGSENPGADDAPGSENGSAGKARLHAVQASMAAFGLSFGPSIAASECYLADWDRPNALLCIQAVLSSFTVILVGPSTMGSTFEALRPGGALARLGAGTTMISTSDARSLQRWRVGLDTMAPFLILLEAGFAWFCYKVANMGTESTESTGSLWGYALAAGFLTMFPYWTVYLCLSFWPSMRLASALVRDDIGEVIQAANVTDPSDQER
eukprot:COSAG01_NODE_1823_length_9143_cov_7.938640_5_plen_290_part_00